jgi:ABC-type uncharacterized transport system permease subunit
MTAEPLLLYTAGLYLAASVGYAACLLLQKPLPALIARLATITAVLFHTVAIGIHCAAAHTTPFTTPAETLSATAWAVALTYLALDATIRPRPEALGAVALPVSFLCLFSGSVFSKPDSPSASDAQLLDTRLVSLHILALLFAFSLLILACACAALYLVQHRLLKQKRTGQWFGRLPSLAKIDHLAFTLVAFAFPLLTIGLCAGAIAAFFEGGQRHWMTDHKVLASSVTWLLYSLYLYFYLALHWRGPRAQFFLLLGIPAALITYFIPTQMHRFG